MTKAVDMGSESEKKPEVSENPHEHHDISEHQHDHTKVKMDHGHYES
jgi:hypothetical protein